MQPAKCLIPPQPRCNTNLHGAQSSSPQAPDATPSDRETAIEVLIRTLHVSLVSRVYMTSRHSGDLRNINSRRHFLCFNKRLQHVLNSPKLSIQSRKSILFLSEPQIQAALAMCMSGAPTVHEMTGITSNKCIFQPKYGRGHVQLSNTVSVNYVTEHSSCWRLWCSGQQHRVDLWVEFNVSEKHAGWPKAFDQFYSSIKNHKLPIMSPSSRIRTSPHNATNQTTNIGSQVRQKLNFTAPACSLLIYVSNPGLAFFQQNATYNDCMTSHMRHTHTHSQFLVFTTLNKQKSLLTSAPSPR